MSFFQWEDIDLNAGNIVVDKIVSVDAQNMTASLEKFGNSVPIHYHCEQSTEDDGRSFDETYPNELDEGGAAAFATGDEVLVLFRRVNNTSPVIIGFRGEPKPCCSRIVFKSNGYYAVWNIASEEVILEPTNDSEDYDFYVPDPFVSSPNCYSISNFYTKRYVPGFLKYGAPEITDEYTHIHIECEFSSMDDDALTSRTLVNTASNSNEFGSFSGWVIHTLEWECNPYCWEGEAFAGCESVGATIIGEQTKLYGYVFEYVNAVTDANKKEAIILEHSIGYPWKTTYTITDPTGGGESEESLDYSIDGYGFYPEDADGNPMPGNVVTWFISKINGTYAVSATNNPTASLGENGEYETLINNNALASMIAKLLSLGGAIPSYILI